MYMTIDDRPNNLQLNLHNRCQGKSNLRSFTFCWHSTLPDFEAFKDLGTDWSRQVQSENFGPNFPFSPFLAFQYTVEPVYNGHPRELEIGRLTQVAA